MATSRREPNPNARTNRAVRNMSPVLKPSEPDQALLRRARSVPNSPDRRSSASTAASSSSNAGRPSSSVNPRTASSRSTSGSSSSSSSAAHGKSALLHSVSAMVGAKQAASTMRRRADNSKSGATSVWPHALTSPNPSPKDPASRAAKSSSSSSSAQKGKLSTRPGAEKSAAAAAASPKPRTQKATGAGKTQAASSSSPRAPGAVAKRRPGPETTAPSIQRTTSVPVAATKADEREVELLMEDFDEMESISTHSIEEHLQERLPDPVDFATYAASEHAPDQDERKSDLEEITEHKFSEEKREDLNGGGNADTDDSEVVVAKEVADEAELNEAATESGLKEPAGETELNETVGQIEMKEAVDTSKLNEAEVKAANETELKDPELAVKEAKANEDAIIPPASKTTEEVQRWKKDDGRSNEVTEEGRSKTSMQERRNRVMALVGRFESGVRMEMRP